MPELKVSVRGVEELQRKLSKLSAAGAGKVLVRSADKAAQPIIDVMKSLVRVSTKSSGFHMREDITAAVRRVSRSEAVISVGPDINTGWRAHFLEFGTKNHPAFPFMRPALEAASPSSLRIFKREFKKEIRRAV